jgi:hypothetical protein
MQQIWIISGRRYGPAPVDPTYKDGLIYRTTFQLAYFCDHCGEIWARRILLASPNSLRWEVSHSRCERCPPFNAYDEPPGTVSPYWNEGFLSTLPPEILRREAELYSRYTTDPLF